MSLPNYISNIKSSGIYRFVWDKSEIPGTQAETLRLVVGYSEKGPFNTPVYVKDETEFKTIYGGISKKLERYGVWFHRLAIQALKKGPILALNIKPFNDESVEGLSFNPQSGLGNVINLAVKELYNTNRFWSLEPERFEEIETSGINEQYISIFATDSKEASNTIFIRGYQPSGYDVTVKEWYSRVLNGEDVPSYLEGHENDYLSQYWAELYVFKGEFTPAIATSDKLAKFFDVNDGNVVLKPYITNAFGEKLDTLEQLAANDASNFVKSYAGILLPEFLSSTNTVVSLDAQFNNDNYVHKMMMRLNQSLLYNGDIDISEIDTTGWTKAFAEGADHTPFMSLQGLNPQVSVVTYTDGEWQYAEPAIDGASIDFYDFQITPQLESETSVIVSQHMGETGIINGDKFLYRDEEGNDVVANLIKVDPITHTVAEYFDDLDYIWKTEIKTDGSNFDVTATMETYTGGNDVMNDLARVIGALYKEDTIGHAQVTFNDDVYVWDDNLTFKGSRYVNVETSNTLVADTVAKFKSDVASGVAIEGYKISVKFQDGCESNTTFHVTETINPGVTSDSTAIITTGYIYTFDKNISEADWTLGGQVSFVKCVNNATYTSANMVPTYLKGYIYSNSKPIDKLTGKSSTKQWDKLQWQHDILDVMTTYKGIRTALTGRVDVDYRYIVDTFEGFVEGECKGRIAAIAKEKDNAFAFLNFPAMSNFSKCNYTSFTDAKGMFDTKYIVQGGNHQKSMGAVFTLVSDENGASYVSYNTCLSMKDVNTGVKFACPAAALVSNLFMDKYTKYFPYTIIAGSKRAVITEPGLIGPDFNFGREDLNNLEPFGVNCMVMVPGIGTYINSNQTAKQNPVTTLSKINVRELCIFLQDEIEKLLQQYHWDFNTPNLRSTIKDRADVILETASHNGGVYKYFNVCNEFNNTEDVINNESFVLSTSIEPGIGAGKMIQELTLYRHGGMSSVITQL